MSYDKSLLAVLLALCLYLPAPTAIMVYFLFRYTIALLVSLTLFFGISYASPRRTLDPEVEALMDI